MKKCSYCGKVLLRKCDFERHSRIDADSKYWNCRVCPKTFPTKACLFVHYSHNHRNRQNFVCKVCGNRFVYKRVFEKHCNQHEEDDVVVKKAEEPQVPEDNEDMVKVSRQPEIIIPDIPYTPYATTSDMLSFADSKTNEDKVEVMSDSDDEFPVYYNNDVVDDKQRVTYVYKWPKVNNVLDCFWGLNSRCAVTPTNDPENNDDPYFENIRERIRRRKFLNDASRCVVCDESLTSVGLAMHYLVGV